MARHLGPVAAVRHIFLTLALVGGTMAAVAGTPQAAAAAGADQLVVVDVAGASSDDLSAVSLKTLFSADNAGNNTAPVNLPTADGGGQKAITLSGATDGNGALSLSDDGSYVSLAGYNRAPGPVTYTHTLKGIASDPNPVTETVTKPKDTYASEIRRGFAKVSATGGTPSVSTVGFSDNTLSSSAARQALGISGGIYLTGNGNGETADSTYNAGTGAWSSRPKNTTDGGVIKVAADGTGKTNISCPGTTTPCTVKQSNARQLALVGNQGSSKLYMDSEKGGVRGVGDWASAVPTSAGTISQRIAITTDTTNDLPAPNAMTLLNIDGTSGADVAYVFIEAATAISPEIRKYTSSDQGTTWAPAGSKSGTYPFFTARYNAADSKVEIFATKDSAPGNTVVSFKDNAPSGTGDFTADSTIATAKSDHAFRGIAFAPTGWDTGTVSTGITADDDVVGGTIGDTNNPTDALTLTDTDTPLNDLTVSATSSDDSVIPDAGVTFTGTGGTRTASFAPTGVGRSDITITVDDHDGHTATTTVKYAASAAPASASGRYLYESSDLSSAVDVGDGYAIAASSEDSTIRLYKKGESNRPAKTFNFESDLGTDKADLESMARAGDTLYVLGSHGNSSSDGSLKPARDVMFTATIAGSGADTDLSFGAKRTGLRDAIKAWDVSNGNALGFAAGQAAGKVANDPDGFNIEGFELAPGSTTEGFLGFRAPVKNDKAILVPVTNLDPTLTGTPEFGDPVFLDLGGRTVREIRKNADDEYLISAHGGASSPEWKLFAWDGNPDHQAIDVTALPAPDANRTGAWESIVSVPHPLTAGGSATLITDSGDTTYHGDATVGTDESKGLSKSYVDEFTTEGFAGYPDAFVAPGDLSSTSKTSSSVTLAWTKVPGATGYILSQGTGAEPRTTTTVGDVSTATFTGLTASTDYTYDIIATKGSTQSAASTPRITVTTSAAPTDRPSNVHWTSRTATSMKLAWTKKSGSAKYKIRYAPAGSTTYKYLTVGNVGSASVSGLSRGKEYSFRVMAISSSGTQSPYSPALIASTSSLRPPTNLASTSRTSTTITLTWTKATGANGYRIYSGVGTTGARTAVEVSGGDTQTVTLRGLRPGRYYTIDIASLEGSGNSRSSYSPHIGVRTSG